MGTGKQRICIHRENSQIAFAGQGDKFNKIALTHIARGVYSVKIPANKIKTDLEYYVSASSLDGKQITFPATAPRINQTVVVIINKEKLR